MAHRDIPTNKLVIFALIPCVLALLCPATGAGEPRASRVSLTYSAAPFCSDLNLDDVTRPAFLPASAQVIPATLPTGDKVSYGSNWDISQWKRDIAYPISPYHITKAEFDIDNDSHADKVIGIEWATHAESNSTFFVVSESRFETPLNAGEDLNVNLGAVAFPGSFFGCTSNECLANKDAQYKLSSKAPSKEEVSYRRRYLHSYPFTLNGVTYFVLSSIDAPQKNTVAIVEPRPDKSAIVRCLLHITGSGQR